MPAQEVIAISPKTSRICRVGAFILERTGPGTETVSRTRSLLTSVVKPLPPLEEVASLLGEVDPGAFEEADAVAKAEAHCYSPFFLRSISASISPRYPHASS
jgi:hypothetical protein